MRLVFLHMLTFSALVHAVSVKPCGIQTLWQATYVSNCLTPQQLSEKGMNLALATPSQPWRLYQGELSEEDHKGNKKSKKSNRNDFLSDLKAHYIIKLNTRRDL